MRNGNWSWKIRNRFDSDKFVYENCYVIIFEIRIKKCKNWEYPKTRISQRCLFLSLLLVTSFFFGARFRTYKERILRKDARLCNRGCSGTCLKCSRGKIITIIFFSFFFWERIMLFEETPIYNDLVIYYSGCSSSPLFPFFKRLLIYWFRNWMFFSHFPKC